MSAPSEPTLSEFEFEANIPPRIRFGLYLAAAVALAGVGYTVDKGWAGAAEFTLVTSLASLANILAAAKTPL